MTTAINFVCVSILMMPLLLLIALPFIVATALLAVLTRRTSVVAEVSRIKTALVGTVMPLLLLSLGLWLIWPSLWHQPEVMRDGMPMEPLPVMAVLPTWLLCIGVSRAILKRRT